MRPLPLRILTGAAATVAVLALGATAAFAETYEVESGDTLTSIADQLDGVDDWQDLADANDHKLDDPNLILPGQILVLPGSDAEVAATAETTDDATGDAPDAATSEPGSQPATGGSVDVATWDRLAECESNGNWSINTGNGYYGGLQFAQSSWEWVGGSGSPHEASKQEQIDRAEILLDRQGWNAWPACSSQLGLR